MKINELLPKVYYEESRDFSYIGRLFEIALNYVKTGADIISAPLNTENIGSLLVDLLTLTLGFDNNPNYLTRDLVDIDSVFITLLRNKGSIQSIKLAIQTLLSSLEIMSEFAVSYTPIAGTSPTLYDYTSLDIYLPADTVDIVLLERIFDYILPAGMLYHIKPSSTNTSPIGNDLPLIGKVFAYKDNSNYGVPTKNTGRVHGINDEELPTAQTSGINDLSEGPDPTETSYNAETNNKRSFTSFGMVVTDNPGASNSSIESESDSSQAEE